jgi:ABC-type polysaccharide/polyol phosphate export permease
MALTKKRLVAIVLVLMVVYFIPLLYLPEDIIGHRDDNMLTFIPKVAFLAITAAFITVFALILVFKKDYLRSQVNTFNRFKYYLQLLIKRDFITRYRKSVLGVLWSVLNPLLTMIVLSLVFQYFFRFEIEHFPVYLLSGSIIYSFFAESTTLALGSIISSEGIIKRIYVPKYVFPLSKVISTLVNLGFSFIAFLLVFTFSSAPWHWTIILVPIPIIYTFIFSLGVAMLVSSLAVMFRDITYLYSVLVMLLQFLTPIFWPVSMLSPQMAPIIGLNPLFQFVNYFRELALWGNIPDLWTNMVCLGYALLAFCGGVAVFMKNQDKYLLSL